MSTGKEYLTYILDQLYPMDGIRYIRMMGEYIIYIDDRIAFYVCDDRLFARPVNAARKMLPDAPLVPPYEGAKPMLLIEDIDNGDLLKRLLAAMYDELPERKKK